MALNIKAQQRDEVDFPHYVIGLDQSVERYLLEISKCLFPNTYNFSPEAFRLIEARRLRRRRELSATLPKAFYSPYHLINKNHLALELFLGHAPIADEKIPTEILANQVKISDSFDPRNGFRTWLRARDRLIGLCQEHGQLDFSCARLNQPFLLGANLEHAKFVGAEIIGGNFTDAKLGFANLSYAKIGASVFQDHTRGGVLSFCPTNFTGTELNQTNGYRASFRRCIFKGANLASAVLREATFQRCEFKNVFGDQCDFSETSWEDTFARGMNNFLGTNFTGAELVRSGISGIFDHANFGNGVSLDHSLILSLSRNGEVIEKIGKGPGDFDESTFSPNYPSLPQSNPVLPPVRA